MHRIKWELEDLCLRYTEPKSYYELVDKISIKRKEREEFIQTIINTFEEKTSHVITSYSIHYTKLYE